MPWSTGAGNMRSTQRSSVMIGGPPPSGANGGAHALVGPAADALFAVEQHQLLADDGLAGAAQLDSSADKTVGAGTADAVDATRARARHHLALAGEGRVGDPPPLTYG